MPQLLAVVSHPPPALSCLAFLPPSASYNTTGHCPRAEPCAIFLRGVHFVSAAPFLHLPPTTEVSFSAHVLSACSPTYLSLSADALAASMPPPASRSSMPPHPPSSPNLSLSQIECPVRHCRRHSSVVPPHSTCPRRSDNSSNFSTTVEMAAAAVATSAAAVTTAAAARQDSSWAAATAAVPLWHAAMCCKLYYT